MAEKSVKFSITAKDRTAATFAKVKRNIKSMNKVALGLGTAIAGAAGIGAFGAMAKNAMDTADKIHKLNIRLGASTEALSQYRHAADLSGVSFSEFVGGLEKMARNVSEAAQGTGTAKDALEELNISADMLSQLAPEEQFEHLADAISQVENPTDRTRIAMDVFGRSGGALLQMMEGGAEGLRAMRQAAHDAGMTMSKDMVTKVAEANDAIQEVTSRITSLVEKLMGSLSPILIEVADSVAEWIDQNRELIGQNLNKIFENLVVTARTMIPVFKGLWVIFQGIGKALGWIIYQAVRLEEKFEAISRVIPGLGVAKNALKLYDAMKNPAPDVPGAADIAGDGSVAVSAGGAAGATVVNNFNTQITRSDAVAIAAESSRMETRK